jgi:adenine-specific DNA-methyltransferase
MPNLSQIKRQRMLDFLETLRREHTDDDSIRAFTEIENHIRDKKYGLVWEEHEEAVDVKIRTHIPVLTEDTEKKIAASAGGVYNFLLEGDNLQSLYLLEKTHRGRIDLIYIDPPYNTGNDDFIYDDNFINPDDGYRHSKWLSFMNQRLRLAYNLLSEEGMIMISIDDNEVAQLKLLCDDIFNENNLISIHHMQVRYSQKSIATEGMPIKPVMEYVLIYAKNASSVVLNLPEQEYTDEKFVFEIKELAEGETIKSADGSEMVVFKPGQWSIEEKEPSISLLKETWISGTIYTKMSYGQVVRKYIEPRYENDGTGCLYKIIGRGDDGLGYRYYVGPQRANSTRCKMYSGMPLERVAEVKAGLAKRKVSLTNLYDYSADFGNIVNEGAVTFNSGKKPVKMLKELISYHPKSDAIVLDFFAGSGSTGEAVLELNKDDGGTRSFILCTNNELSSDAQTDYFVKKGLIRKRPGKKTLAFQAWMDEWHDFKKTDTYISEISSSEYVEQGICYKITYPRLRTVITGKKPNGSKYSDGMVANLKFFRCDWTPRKPEEYLLSNALCLHIREMIELQNGIEVDNAKNVLILNKADFRKYVLDDAVYAQIENIWVNQNIIFNSAEMEKLNALGFKYIPREFFGQELREAAE